MASPHQVRQYLAYWFQLGKKVWVRNGQYALLPEPIIQGDGYSPEFESCWQLLHSPESGDCYLEGMTQTIDQLLKPEWELLPCARCQLPVPLRTLGLPPLSCPCSDLSLWPNTELPPPRLPVNTQQYLDRIRQRLLDIEH